MLARQPPSPELHTPGPTGHMSMATTFSRWADACVPVWRTEEIRVDGQVLHVGDQAGWVGVSFFHLPSPGLWAVWATPWGCPSGVVRPATPGADSGSAWCRAVHTTALSTALRGLPRRRCQIRSGGSPPCPRWPRPDAGTGPR